MAVVLLVLGLVAGDNDPLDIGDDDEITRVNVRRIDRLVLATQTAGDFGSEAAEHLVCGVNHKPLALHLMWLGGKRFHVCAVLKELGADWRKPEIVFDLPEDCQSKAGKGSPRKKRGSTSRVKSTPKEEGGGDNLNCRNRCDRANSSPYAVHYALRARHWQEPFLQRSISILIHGLQLLIAMPALAHVCLRKLMQRSLQS
jgi:hypothetical protein